MCGIVGYAGKGRVAPVLMEGLRRLEYRGYDSAGIAVLGQKLAVVKRKGRVEALASEAEKLSGCLGIAHTRWATHGEPSERNAHPHRYGGVAVVHNGIIENAALLRAECEARGEVFSSETDSEVIAHLVAAAYRGDLLRAVQEAVRQLKGSYSIAVLAEGVRFIVAARRGSPLLVGRGEGSVLASDLPAIAPLANEVYSLKEGGFALLTEDNVRLFDEELREWKGEPIEFGKVEGDGGKGGYPHYMRKEIAEDPAAIANSIVDLTADPQFSDISIVLCQTYYIQIVACGTAYHSGVAAKYAIEALSRVPVEVDIASEYRYRDPIVPKGTLVIAVSQSGETADTLSAAALAKERGAKVLALTNVPYSSLTALADLVLLTHAGRETAVAATKSFCAQLASLYSLAAALAALKGRSAPSLAPFPAFCEDALSRSEKVKEWARALCQKKSVYFIGRGADYAAAIEGSLKLKEVSYLASEGYPAGELKHGTLALVGEDAPVVALLSDERLAEKTMNAVYEVRSRGARVFLITTLPSCAEGVLPKEDVLLLPACEAVYSPLCTAVPLQLLAYETAVLLGHDPDKPRNLAKSVTVE